MGFKTIWQHINVEAIVKVAHELLKMIVMAMQSFTATSSVLFVLELFNRKSLKLFKNYKNICQREKINADFK